MEASFYVEVLLKNNIFQAAIFQFRFSSPSPFLATTFLIFLCRKNLRHFIISAPSLKYNGPSKPGGMAAKTLAYSRLIVGDKFFSLLRTY